MSPGCARSTASALRAAALTFVCLLVLGARPAAGQSPTPAKTIVLLVTWRLDVSGYGSEARVELQALYEVRPWKEFQGGGDWGKSLPEAVCGGSAERRCFVLKYRSGRLVSSSGKNSVGDAALFTEAPEEPAAGLWPDGLIRPGTGGSVEIIFYRRPGFRMENGAAEEALGCWSHEWLVPKISDSELRNLESLQRTWEVAAMGAEEIAAATDCQPGRATLEIRATGVSACEPLQSACQRAQQWQQCAREGLQRLLADVEVARSDVATAMHTFPQEGMGELVPLLTRFDATLVQLRQQTPGWIGDANTALISTQKNCILLPGPKDEAACRQATQRVEAVIQGAQQKLTRNLDEQMVLIENAAQGLPDYPGLTAMTRLRATVPTFKMCRVTSY